MPVRLPSLHITESEYISIRRKQQLCCQSSLGSSGSSLLPDSLVVHQGVEEGQQFAHGGGLSRPGW